MGGDAKMRILSQKSRALVVQYGTIKDQNVDKMKGPVASRITKEFQMIDVREGCTTKEAGSKVLQSKKYPSKDALDLSSSTSESPEVHSKNSVRSSDEFD